MTGAGVPLDLLGWIAANASSFEPPVANRVVWPDSEFIFMVVRGPNARNDFHVDPGDEIFYQLRGDIRVDVIDSDGVREKRIVREGDVMLVPAGMPHAPMRPADTWGVVIERRRAVDELDQLVWFCDHCGNELARAEFHVNDIETELKRAIEVFNADTDLRRCGRCDHLQPVPEPFSLDER